MAKKKHLLGMTMDELRAVASECGLPKFAAKQIADWVYKKAVSSIDEMTNLSVTNREKLAEAYAVGVWKPTEMEVSVDGTTKYLFRTLGGKLVETVMIPEDNRTTLCVSSQIGCKRNCLFCLTGKQGFAGNLTANEILNQMYSVAQFEDLTNVVFMGMGEPLDNYDELKKVLEIMTADYGMAWSPKRITVSTTGITPVLQQFLEESSVHLAISIHSPLKEQRLTLMPAEKMYPIHDVIALLRQYDWSKQRRLSFEYIMFDGLNDSQMHAKELVKILSGIECRINLIRYHAIPSVELQSSKRDTMEVFKNYMTRKGFTCTIRSSRGEDISAACGMLSTKKKKETGED